MSLIATITIVIIVSLIIILAYIRFQRLGGFKFPWLTFYLRGKEANFTLSEINLFRKATVYAHYPEPTNVFWSEKAFNACIREVIIYQRSHNLEEDSRAIEFLSQLFELRKRVEMNLPQYTRGIADSRDIEKGQFIKILAPAIGVYGSRVIENLRKYFAITYPEGVSPGLGWSGQPVRVHFWRVNDAAYSFDSDVTGDFTTEGILHLKHSNKLVRIQKRTSIRIGLNQGAQLFLLKKNADADEKFQTGNAFRCKLINISEAGAGIMIGGRAKAGKLVKIQTELGGESVVLSGIIKNLSFQASRNVSILNIKAVPLSKAMKNRILMYVYGIFAEEL